ATCEPRRQPEAGDQGEEREDRHEYGDAPAHERGHDFAGVRPDIPEGGGQEEGVERHHSDPQRTEENVEEAKRDLQHEEILSRMGSGRESTRNSLASRPQADIDRRDDIPWLAAVAPTTMAATVVVVITLVVVVAVAAITLLPEPAHRHPLVVFTIRGREDTHDLVITAPGPDDAVGSGVLHAVDRPAARHEHILRHDYDAIHRYIVLVLHRLPVNELGTGVSRGAARETQGRENDQPFHRARLLK